MRKTACFSLDSFGNADGAGGADQTAKVATHTLGAYDVDPAGVGVEGDGLVTTIHAGDVATSTTDAQVVGNLREDDGLAV